MTRASGAGALTVAIFASGLLLGDDGAGAFTKLSVFPPAVELHGNVASERLVVLGERAGEHPVDLTAHANLELESADDRIARVGPIDHETRPAVLARGSGETRIEVRFGELRTEVPVRVESFDPDRPPRFIDDVLARLTRAGCNSGSCHGSQHGRGGFKLSLLGYEPDLDIAALSRAQGSRRIDTEFPEQSLILQKPLTRIAHEGGQRFEPDSATHRILGRWIGAGAPSPAKDDPTVASLDVFPRECVLAPGEEAFIVATASLSDGTTEDVTGRALLGSLNDGVAEVDGAGRITAQASGETALMVRYQGRSAIVRVVIPYRKLDGPLAFEPVNFIDELAARKWAQLGLEPSPPCSDGEFIRRLYLSVLGTLPAADEARDFIDDADSAKREKLISRILERPEYVDFQALAWGDLLRINRTTMDEKGMWSLHQWVRNELRENRPIDEMVRTLITAQGSTYTVGPANFYRVARQPNELAETAAQVFLGLRLQCAQCHHHPFEEWTQDDYWGLAAYFARVGVKQSSEFGVYGREQVVYVRDGGEVRQPRTGRVVPPTPLGAPPSDDPIDRRRALARWLTSPRNELFARNMANRLWSGIFGRGLVEPIDDLRVTNPPSNPELLDALAAELVRVRFDQKAFLQTLLRSRLFSLASVPTARNEGDEVFFSHFPVHRLSAEVLHDAICAVTGVPDHFDGVPAGSRAIELPDPNFSSYFLDAFGRPERAIACACERGTQPNVAQALHLINGDFIQKRVADKDGRIAALEKGERPLESIVEELYLSAFARRPTADEIGRAQDFAKDAPNRREAVEDLLWALLNATEFLFQH